MLIFRFFTRTDSSKVPEIKNHSQVNVSFSDPSHQSYVSVSGRAEVIQNKAKAKELWNPYLKAWFVFFFFF
jgi:general stress protein 26